MNLKNGKYFLATILLIMFLISSLLTNSQNLDNTYRVLKKIEDVEIREYSPLLYASYLNQNGENNQNSSFRVLADYIFGSNDKQEKIAMTSPVIIKLHNDREMLFRMPEKYNNKNVPNPTNSEIKIIKSNKLTRATIRFSGYTNEKKETKMIKRLKEVLDKHNIKHNNEFELFVYDPPYKPLNRRNEISVNIIN